jgi:lysozyme
MAKVSPKALATGVAGVLLLAAPLIAKWEGVRYMPYRDVVGVLTVCYGHTGPDVQDRPYTKAECDALLMQDMREADAIVRRCVARPMPQRVEAALVSLTFNIGGRPVCQGVIGAHAREGDWESTCALLDVYRLAGGRVYRGLVLRRADERAVCEGRA